MSWPEIRVGAVVATIGDVDVSLYLVEVWPKGVRVLGYLDEEPLSVASMLRAVVASPNIDDDATTAATSTDRLGVKRLEWQIPLLRDTSSLVLGGVDVLSATNFRQVALVSRD